MESLKGERISIIVDIHGLHSVQATVFVDGKREPLYATKIVEVVYRPDGSEKERRDPKSYPSNLLEPRHWSGKYVPPATAARRFAFTRKYSVRHVDPLSFDFLHGIASHLEEENALLVVGSGPKGTGPYGHNE